MSPIEQHEKSILYLLEKHRILLIIGETGNGKSSRIPQILYLSGAYKTICVTQPRKVAAARLANWVSKEINLSSNNDDTDTIKFTTDGQLVREMITNPLLDKYSIIMVDEVHERTLNTDLLLGLLKCVMIKRTDLKLIICSSTMHTDNMVNFFTYNETTSIEKPAILCVPGREFPLKIYYRKKPVPNYLDASVETVINIHESNRLASGKILVFVTGQDEIEYVCSKLKDYSHSSKSRLELRKLVVLPFHASLTQDEVKKVFAEYGRNSRATIVATNAAETSLTIEDVAFVIDCGYTKIKIFNPRTGLEALVRVPISKGSAIQRAGRAGRTRAGAVYRLYPEEEYEQLDDGINCPEIQRYSLMETVLILKAFGVENLQGFPLVSPMPRENLVAALDALHSLKVIDETGKLIRNREVLAQFNLSHII